MTEDYSKLREIMVSSQLVPRGIRDERVLAAMRKVPRHIFMGEEIRYRAYDDSALPIGDGQTISQPYMVAVMTELLELKGDEKVLEIGTGSGYQAAILSELSKTVCTIERYDSLMARAKEKLVSLGYDNILYRVGDGTLGWPEEALFQRIMVTAGAPSVPPPLFEQLDEGGIIVIPVGDRYGQSLIKGVKQNGRLIEQYHTPCVFVPLVGEFGWKEDRSL